MALAALQPQPKPKATPRSTEWCESGQHGAWHTVVPLHKQLRVAFTTPDPSSGDIGRRGNEMRRFCFDRRGKKGFFLAGIWQQFDSRRERDGRNQFKLPNDISVNSLFEIF
jgi:hypothetical protein